MQAEQVTFQGPPIDDADLLARVPADLAAQIRNVPDGGEIEFQVEE